MHHTMAGNTFDISVIIPAFNRVDLLRASIGSVLGAARRGTPLTVECVVVDDESEPPLGPQLADLTSAFAAPHSLRVIRQANAGSAAARLTGLREARGEFIQFLDSDDLIHPEKLAAHVRVMRETGAELSYCDQAVARPYDPLTHPDAPPLVSQQTLPLVHTPSELFLGVQTAPHTPVFRRDALLIALADPIIPPSRVFEPAGDTWMFFNCATQPWRVQKVDGHFSIYVNHESERLSNRWEKLGVPALGITLVFALRCPEGPDTLAARTALGVAAFNGYRRLPRRFHADYEWLTLDIFRTAPQPASLTRLGGRQFARLAALFGATWAARLLRWVQCGNYLGCQTISRDELTEQFSRMLRHVLALCGEERFRARFGQVPQSLTPETAGSRG